MSPAVAALLLQAVAAPATPPPVAAVASPVKAAPALRPLDAQVAIDTFKALCWDHFRERDDLRAAVPLSTIPLAETPRTRPGPAQSWHADEALLTYTAADDLPADLPSRQCTLRTRLAGAANQLALSARVATTLSLHGGTTHTLTTGAQTSWDVRQPDGRTARLIVSTANAPGGQSDLRQLVLLLSPK